MGNYFVIRLNTKLRTKCSILYFRLLFSRKITSFIVTNRKLLFQPFKNEASTIFERNTYIFIYVIPDCYTCARLAAVPIRNKGCPILDTKDNVTQGPTYFPDKRSPEENPAIRLRYASPMTRASGLGTRLTGSSKNWQMPKPRHEDRWNWITSRQRPRP